MQAITILNNLTNNSQIVIFREILLEKNKI